MHPFQEGVVRQPPRPQQKKLPSLPIDALNESVLATIDGECRKNVGDRRESGARGRGRAFYADVDIGALAGRLMRSDFGVNATRITRYLAALRAAASRSG